MRWILISLLGVGFGEVPSEAAQLCSPKVDWQRARPDIGFNTFKPTSDGGYFLAGPSFPGSDSGQTSPNYGGSDFYLVRVNAGLEKIWDKTFGGTSWDNLAVAQELPGGGFILAGDSLSPPGGNKTSPFYGVSDFWLVRTDANGNKIWDQSYGGINLEALFCLQQTADGGFIFGGSSESAATGNKSSVNFGYQDYWVVRTDGAGNKLWDRSFGGSSWDVLHAIQQTPDGGFILGGSSESVPDGSKTAQNFGGRDYWIIRLDANGAELWQASFGGDGNDDLIAIGQSASGFALVGSSDSLPSGNKTSPSHGYRDYWIVFIDTNGNKIWEESAGAGYAEAKSVLSMPDGGWIVGGVAGPGVGGNKTSPRFGDSDYWLVRVGLNGAILWDQSYGGRSTDDFFSMDRLVDGGILLEGRSLSGIGGNKTVPLLGGIDLWILKLGLETPGDCDGDGIPDDQDLCGATSGDFLVNSNGCSITQLCPCDGGWRDHAEYLDCVVRTSGDFFNAGRITDEQRSNIIARAAAAACPFPPVIAFGLTNFPIHGATVSFGSEAGNTLLVSNLGFEGGDGLSIRLGQADSGIFIYPDAPIQDNYDPAWFMLGKASGALNGVSNSLLSIVRATKPNYETYPVEVDFSPLGASSLTFQVYNNKDLVTQVTQPGAVGSVTINSASYLGPRANPLWRAQDGSIGVRIDLDTSMNPFRFSITGIFGETQGDHIFIRADGVTNHVDFVSNVDLFVGGGVFNFSVLNARLGMFGRAHQALGSGIFNAAAGKLTLTIDPLSDQLAGTLIEADQATLLDVNLEPLVLQTNAAFEVRASGIIDAEIGLEQFGVVALTNIDGRLQVNADFSPLYPPPDSTNPIPRLVQVKVYNSGSFVGCLTNSGVESALFFHSSNSTPAIVACAATAGASDGPRPFLSLSSEQLAALNDGNSGELQGNYFRFSPIDPERHPAILSAVSLGGLNFPSFTINAERTETSGPSLSIARSQNALTLSWAPQNQPFSLESTHSLGAPFGTVANEVTFGIYTNSVSVPIEPASNRFFRLVLSSD